MKQLIFLLILITSSLSIAQNLNEKEIKLTETKPSCKDANEMNTKLSVFKNAIFDFKIVPPEKEVKSINGKINFGGHICKTAINY
ncbi:hypothetical protein U8527_02200 [Kordia algicida OT-1]|uniref:Uncharacterized protein n=1 Tax=Kordia algicida OT-1 TaxID=391587 RepID=A9DN61_9FLAO|nr:hypothetical protein [Kordia algicida]EDP97120.1 hypothetical protein KAOT1_18197 [Kordia algicida OT-1]